MTVSEIRLHAGYVANVARKSFAGLLLVHAMADARE